jgi:hypothetical protein
MSRPASGLVVSAMLLVAMTPAFTRLGRIAEDLGHDFETGEPSPRKRRRRQAVRCSC